MSITKLILVATITTLLFGCAAAGVPYTSDPFKKIGNGYALMNMGRGLPAEKLAKEALKTFEENNNKNGIAEAHILLGQLYKQEFFGKNVKSAYHSGKAIAIYEGMGNHTQAAKAKFAQANAYLQIDKAKACNLYEASLGSLKRGRIENPKEKFQFNPHFKSAEDMISGFKTHNCAENS